MKWCFELKSKRATRVELWRFAAATDGEPSATHLMTADAGIWRIELDDVESGDLYGFRVWGPNWPYDPDWKPGTMVGFRQHVDREGNRFNPNKLLLDPYGRASTGEPLRVFEESTGVWRYDPSLLGGREPCAALDSAAAMPKSVVVDGDFDWRGDVRPNIPVHESIIYEMNLRGFSMMRRDIAKAERGSYQGLIASIPYLKQLGITAIELLPIHEFLRWDEPIAAHGELEQRKNYWGYMTHGFFAPMQAYAAPGPDGKPVSPVEAVSAFKRMVRALHEAGIEVWLDVVFNHTGEGGPCRGGALRYLNFRGIDNEAYYTLRRDGGGYWDSTGTGNNLNASREEVQDLVLDSLRYWIEEMHVDGFRFDLAFTLGRVGEDGRVFDPKGRLLTEIAKLGKQHQVKMIAEAWDIAGYGVGRFPEGWLEWNGPWRDNVRRFVKGDPGQVGALGRSITASWEGFRPTKSVNFLTAHDGLTLNDLVTYGRKENRVGPCNPLGLDPASGTDRNDSWSTDGDESLRRQQLRNLAAHLFLHQGVPMVLAGDEIRNTQYGNNNAYMADNPCGWLDWEKAEYHPQWQGFFRRLLKLRKRHPALGQIERIAGEGEIRPPGLWWHGKTPHQPDWSHESRFLAYVLSGDKRVTGAPLSAPDLYVAMNAHWEAAEVELPNPPEDQLWWRVMDTAAWAETEGNLWYDPAVAKWDQLLLTAMPKHYRMSPRSTLLLMARPKTAWAAYR